MRAARTKPLIIAGLLFQTVAVLALSTPIGRELNFPKDYSPAKAGAIRGIIQDEQFKFVGGIVSHWEPDFGTRLSFEGDAKSLNAFLNRLRELPGIGLRIILYHGRNDELRRDSTWQLDFSQARPDQVAVYLNLNSATLDFEQVKLPDWPPNPNSSPGSEQK